LFVLQWVHGRAAVVMPGYHLDEYGNCVASMGPRPRGRGDVKHVHLKPVQIKLQWVHGRAAVVMRAMT